MHIEYLGKHLLCTMDHVIALRVWEPSLDSYEHFALLLTGHVNFSEQFTLFKSQFLQLLNVNNANIVRLL